MRSGGGVLLISALELIVGVVLLGVFEGFKSHYFAGIYNEETKAADTSASVVDGGTFGIGSFRTPLDFVFYFSIVNSVFAVLGFAGVINGQRELVTGFFVYNAVQMVVAFAYFVDVSTDVGIRYRGLPPGLTAYEQTAAAFIFINFLLAIAATIFAMKAVDEIKTKQREEYSRISVLSDTLQYEMENQ